MVRYEEVKDMTTEEYFRGNQFSIDAFNAKYRDHEGETYVQAVHRVCTSVASVEETPELRAYWATRWFDEIFEDWWHPSGSIMQGAGTKKKISLANCTTVSLGGTAPADEDWDNLESIFRSAAYTIAKAAAYRQGLGVDFSRLRPRGMRVHNSANYGSGAVDWMKFIDSIGYHVGQAGRIPAMLFSISCEHPDVLEFIGCKADRRSVQNANISVQCTDAFYEAVRNDGDWTMVFEVGEVAPGDRIYIDYEAATSDCCFDERGRRYRLATHARPRERFERVEKARKILELIARGMCDYAEPGIQNIDLARHWSNSDYVYSPEADYDSRILSTNACSEQYLSRDSLCVLASQNAGRFPIDRDEFEAAQAKIASSMNRFLDNVNELELRNNTSATPTQRKAIVALRRTGAGFTNLDEWLFRQGMEYGSTEAVAATRYYAQRFNYHLYRQSIETGREKGSFGLFDRKKLERSPFIQKMMALGLEFDALRNITCSSIAPTGTLTLMFRETTMSYGAEPGFGLYYWKRTRVSGKYEYYFCVPAAVRRMFLEKGRPLPMAADTIRDTWDGQVGRTIAKFIETHRDEVGARYRAARDVSPLEKLEMMAAMMESVDSSISITYLLPEGTDWKGVYDFLLLAHEKGIKSVAAFPDRQMYGIVSSEPFRDLARRLVRAGVAIHPQNFSEDEAKQLDRKAPDGFTKRPRSLAAEIHLVRVKNEEYFVCVGLKDGLPYEVFAGSNQQAKLSRSPKVGEIIKVARGHYRLVHEGKCLCESLTDHLAEDAEGMMRMVSMCLRHGTGLAFAVHQLEKVKGTMQSLARGVARVLKRYIADGTVVSGEECPGCSGPLVREEGCLSCKQCGWSKCS